MKFSLKYFLKLHISNHLDQSVTLLSLRKSATSCSQQERNADFLDMAMTMIPKKWQNLSYWLNLTGQSFTQMMFILLEVIISLPNTTLRSYNPSDFEVFQDFGGNDEDFVMSSDHSGAIDGSDFDLSNNSLNDDSSESNYSLIALIAKRIQAEYFEVTGNSVETSNFPEINNQSHFCFLTLTQDNSVPTNQKQA